MALVAALFVTGAGLIVLGRPVRAVVWLTLLLLASASRLTWPFLGSVAATLVWLASVLDAGLVTVPAGSSPSKWRTVGLLLLFLAFGGGLQLVERSQLVEPYRIPSDAMSPTLVEGDNITVDRRKMSVARGDVVVFSLPTDPAKDFVKRIIALPGDALSMREGRLTVNGKDIIGPAPSCSALGMPQSDADCVAHLENAPGRQPYVVVYVRGAREFGSIPDKNGNCPVGMELKPSGCLVPAGHAFVMGDNRDNSYDSRHWGPLDLVAVKGRVKGVHFSFSNGTVRWERLGLTVF